MKQLLYFFSCLSMVVLMPFISFAQYILNGNATQESCNCYQLTEPVVNQSGSVWQSTKINLNDSFDFSFNVYLGCRDADGADGIVFILQPLSTSLGGVGGSMGFKGISPSIGIALDTWQNIDQFESFNDPVYDHISIQKNGVMSHTNDLAGPIPASASSDNIEDCVWHILRVKWDPVTHTLSTYFDGVFRLSTQTDMVATIFNNDPMVYWGFSGATGGSYNFQKFCTQLDPVYNSNLTNDAICFGTPVTFKDSSNSFTTIKEYYWDFGDGTTSNVANPPPHNYSKPGMYEVKHTITAADGCVSQPYTKIISIGDNPDISFNIFDTCQNQPPRLNVNAVLNVGTVNQWKWELDGALFSTFEKPDFTKLAPGTHSIKLTTASNIGCTSNTYEGNFTIKNSPAINFDVKDGCENQPVLFSAQQSDKFTTVNKWQWDFGDNSFSDQKDTEHAYNVSFMYPVTLSATASNGCESSVIKNIFINSVHASAGKDTIVIENTLFQLHGSGGSQYSWSPSTGLNNPDISNPIGKVSDDITYFLTVKTIEGCTDTSSMKVNVFKGSAIYVPTAFTPNNDGLNDVLKPYFIGIKSLYYFSIYDRWGKEVFLTREINKGWNGFSQGKVLETGSYVWILKAEDIVGKIYNLKGAFVLLK
jgi:gliding motility-associated-like protein